MLCSLLVLLVLAVLVRSGLPVPLVPVPVLVLAVLVLFVLFVLAVLAVLSVLPVLAVLVLVDGTLLAEAVCALNGSGSTRASSSSVASIETRDRPAGDRVSTRVFQQRALLAGNFESSKRQPRQESPPSRLQ